MSRVLASRVRGPMIRTAAVAAFAAVAWTTTIGTAAAVNPSGPDDPRCILAQGNPICANGPWVAVQNPPAQDPLPKGPTYDPMTDPSNPADPNSMLNPSNPISPLNPTSPTNPMNSIPSTPSIPMTTP